MKAYKGFNKDMTCRGFQFEEGKTYEEPEAKMCEKGFHACENPIETFYYYGPNKSIYREVEIDDDVQHSGLSSKVCGKKITIKEELSVSDICELHFEYVKKRTRDETLLGSCASFSGTSHSSLCANSGSSLAAHDHSSLSTWDDSSLAAQGDSSLMARHHSSLAAQDNSSLMAQQHSSIAAQDCSTVAAEGCSSIAAQDRAFLSAQGCSCLAAQDDSSLMAQDYSSLAAQGHSSLAAQDSSSLAALSNSDLLAKDGSALAAQGRSSLTARDHSALSAMDYSALKAGENCVLTAFNSKAKAGLGSVIVLANRERNMVNGNYVITGFCAGVVDGVNLMPDVWYRIENGKFVEC